MKLPSTKPYLIRSIYEWCNECGYTPLLSVKVSPEMSIPADSVKNDEIIFNIDHGAVHNLVIGNDIISFSARFGGVAKEIIFPTDAVKGIFAKEVNQGIAFSEVQHDMTQQQKKTERDDKAGLSAAKNKAAGKKSKTKLRLVK
ncbi:ClpXP protease specificity-enhancing factor [Nitrosomonas aestuarii]|uniref:ClpXP protease specificity-enhancing factor n=1 Tax=Nitrosomonas aestuarii TaxID=52441 RepID=UPI000D31571E|nr:ClpXP protease specificity-enhancing factor [Nitrosomonas aestuarii]PTN08868.1 stringent starvation protein B [Nitrosomonas aestuarii]